MPLFPELRQHRTTELMNWLTEPTPNGQAPEEDCALWLEEIAIRIAQTGWGGISFLLWCIPKAEELKLRAIFVALASAGKRLSERKRTEICHSLRPLLEDARPLILAEVIDTLRHLGCRQVTESVALLRDHSSPYVVGSVLRFLARISPDKAVSLLENALASPEPIVRQNAIDELDDLNHVPALAKIRRLLKDPDSDVRQAAQTAVKNLEELLPTP